MNQAKITLHLNFKSSLFSFFKRRESFMEIIYRNVQGFKKEDLEDLFLSLNWSSGHYPDKLQIAMQNYDTVYTAWDQERLVGLIAAMDDGVMTAYIHYMLVRPEYEGMGIGRKLMELTKEKYKQYLKIVLIAYDSAIPFYNKLGFQKGKDESPMFITSLWA
jgi:ribosomal protein S18 acetylase RimI-like enzyme